MLCIWDISSPNEGLEVLSMCPDLPFASNSQRDMETLPSSSSLRVPNGSPSHSVSKHMSDALGQTPGIPGKVPALGGLSLKETGKVTE